MNFEWCDTSQSARRISWNCILANKNNQKQHSFTQIWSNMNKISNNKFCFLHSIFEHHGLKLRVFHKLIHSAVSLSLYIQYNWILIQPIDSAVSLELLGPGISPVKTVPPGEDQRGFSRGAGETLMRFQLPTGQVGLVGWHVFFGCSSFVPKKNTNISGSQKRLMMAFKIRIYGVGHHPFT